MHFNVYFSFLLFNSSGATSLNYRGKCSVKISHVCREVITHVKKTNFDFMDGENLLSSTFISSFKMIPFLVDLEYFQNHWMGGEMLPLTNRIM